jgi:hypothetical protein
VLRLISARERRRTTATVVTYEIDGELRFRGVEQSGNGCHNRRWSSSSVSRRGIYQHPGANPLQAHVDLVAANGEARLRGGRKSSSAGSGLAYRCRRCAGTHPIDVR